jgi:hypothetical protein
LASARLFPQKTKENKKTYKKKKKKKKKRNEKMKYRVTTALEHLRSTPTHGTSLRHSLRVRSDSVKAVVYYF